MTATVSLSHQHEMSSTDCRVCFTFFANKPCSTLNLRFPCVPVSLPTFSRVQQFPADPCLCETDLPTLDLGGAYRFVFSRVPHFSVLRHRRFRRPSTRLAYALKDVDRTKRGPKLSKKLRAAAKVFHNGELILRWRDISALAGRIFSGCQLVPKGFFFLAGADGRRERPQACSGWALAGGGEMKSSRRVMSAHQELWRDGDQLVPLKYLLVSCVAMIAFVLCPCPVVCGRWQATRRRSASVGLRIEIKLSHPPHLVRFQ